MEREEMNKWQAYTVLYKKGRIDSGNLNGVVSYLKPDILEYKVEWDLKSITTNKSRLGDRISAELFKILEDDAVKVLHSVQFSSVHSLRHV